MKSCHRSVRSAAGGFALAALVSLSTASLPAQILVNGSFETGTPGYGGVNTVVNTGIISGWTVITTSGTSEVALLPLGNYTGNTATIYPSAADGSQFLAFNSRGATPGTIQLYQDFATTPGTSYSGSFVVGASGAAFPVMTNDAVSLSAEVYNVVSGAASGGALFSTTTGGTSMGTNEGQFFMATLFSFTASGTTTRLIFSDLSSSTNRVDTLLDGVSLTAGISPVPEPSTYAMLAGVGALACAAWRRRRRRTA